MGKKKKKNLIAGKNRHKYLYEFSIGWRWQITRAQMVQKVVLDKWLAI